MTDIPSRTRLQMVKAALRATVGYPSFIAQDIQYLIGRLDSLMAAAKEAREYFDQRSDIHPENPHAPNEEMHLWEELNNAILDL